MHNSFITAAFITALMLTGCGKSNDTEQSADTPAAPVSERGTSMTDQAVQAGKETWESAKQATGEAADAVADKSREVYESAKATASEAGTAIGEKAEEIGNTLSDKSAEYTDAAKEKTGEAIDSMKQE